MTTQANPLLTIRADKTWAGATVYNFDGEFVLRRDGSPYDVVLGHSYLEAARSLRALKNAARRAAKEERAS